MRNTLTPYNGGHLKKIVVPQLVNELKKFHGICSYITVFTKTLIISCPQPD